MEMIDNRYVVVVFGMQQLQVLVPNSPNNSANNSKETRRVPFACFLHLQHAIKELFKKGGGIPKGVKEMERGHRM